MEASFGSTDLTILILEDNADDALLIQRELRREGFQANIILTRNEAEYMEALSPQVDVVLSDDNLPGYDSGQALAALQARGYDIPFILISGTLSEEVAVLMLKRGAVDYLLKDRMSRLGISIRGALEERRQRQERQHTERRLLQSQQRFKRIFDAATDVILLIDGLNDTILDANQAAHELLGYAPSALVGVQWTYLLAGKSPLESGTLLDAVQEVSALMVTNNFLRADGHILPMDMTATLMDDQDGQWHILATLRDVTQKLRIEEERANAERLLSDLQRERVLNEQRRRFFEFTTHELKNPLTSIISASDILVNYFDRVTPDDRLRHINTINIDAKRLRSMSEDLLVLGRLDEGLSKIEMHALNLEQHVAEQVQTYQQMFKDQPIEYNSQSPVLIMDGDPRLIQLIISNLLSNAVRYSPDHKTIRIQLWREDHHILLAISDQGIGIPLSDQGTIFEAFARASNARSINGTGLGLSIVKHAVELHNGVIQFTSLPGQGTTFTIQFPVRRGYTGQLPPMSFES